MTKIKLPYGNMEDILARLAGCEEVFQCIKNNMPEDTRLNDAMFGAIDLLRSITRDFQADVDSAEEVSA